MKTEDLRTMSNEAKNLIAQRLNETDGSVPFDEMKEELEDELGVKWNTAQNYIYKYANYGKEDGARKVFSMTEEHKDAVQQMTATDSEPGEFTRTSEVPPATGKMFENLEVRQEGHPLVPEVGQFVKRPMGGPDVSVDFNEGTTLVEVLTGAMAADDYGALMIGPPGTGKSYASKYVASQCNLPHSRVNFGSRITKEKLVGGYVPKGNGDALDRMLEKAKEMSDENDDLSTGEALEVIGVRDKFEWQDGILTERVRYGGIFQADELNAAPPEALMALHGLLEDAENRSLELLEKGEVVQPHDDFMFVGTMNPPSFAGTQPLNDALKGRLIPIRVPHLEPKAEKGLLADTTDLSKSEADDLVEMAIDIRSTDNVPPCTLRELKQIAEMKAAMGLEGATRMILLSQSETETEKDAVQKRIDMAF